MSDWLKNITEKIKNLNVSVNQYKKDTVVQSLPSLTYVNRAKKFIEEDRLEEAKGLLLDALELPQKDALVYKYLGIIYDKQKDFQEAVNAYQNSADINPQDKIIWQKLGFALIAAGKFVEAEKSFENADKISPLNTDTFTGWGMALMKLHKYDEAVEKFGKASKINKYNFSAIFLGAVMNIKMGQYDKAEAKLSFLANVCPNETNTYEFANLKFIKGDYANAIHYAKKSLEYNPSMLPAYILLGKTYALDCNKEESLAAFETAEEKELITSTMLMEWAIILIKFGEYKLAQEKLLKALAMDADNHQVMAYLVLSYFIQDSFDDAKNLLDTAVEKEPDNIVVKLSLGIRAYINQETNLAIASLRESLKDEADDSLSYYYLAKCYERQNNDSKVKENYDMALSKNPKFAKVYLEYVKYLISKEEYHEAQRKLRRALKLDESDMQILNLLFFAGYMLVKEDGCEYNIKETLAIAQKIEEKSPEFFEYSGEKNELTNILMNK